MGEFNKDNSRTEFMIEHPSLEHPISTDDYGHALELANELILKYPNQSDEIVILSTGESQLVYRYVDGEWVADLF